jgi:hypothetical protein
MVACTFASSTHTCSPLASANLPSGCGTIAAARLAGLIQTTSATANAAVAFTVTRPASSVVRVFFRGQRLNVPAAGTSDVTASTSSSAGTATCTSYHATSSSTAMDDFYIEVIGGGASVVTIANLATPDAVWGNHYLSQPVFSQTITT